MVAAEERRKKHELKIIAALAVLCAVVYAAAAGLLLLGSDKQDPAAEALNLPGPVRTIEISTGGDQFTLTRNFTDWECAERPEVPVNSVMVSIMSTSFNGLEAERIIPAEKVQAADFGLAAPDYVIRAVDAGGVEKTYRIGTFNGLLGQYYVQVEGDEQAYLINKSMMVKLIKNFLNLVDTPNLKDVTASEVKEYLIDNGSQNYRIFPEGEIYRFEVDGRIYDGDKYSADNIFYALKNIDFDNCVTYTADADDLAAYGLNEPDIQVTMDVDGKLVKETIVCRIAENDDGTAYVNVRENSIVYLITAEELAGVKEDVELSTHIDVK